MLEPRAPREVALRILQEAFGPEPEDEWRWTFPLTPFQEEGRRRAEGILARRTGAVLADAVGLGKTYVALAVIEQRFRAGGEVVVVVPAALRRTWVPLLKEVGAGEGSTAGWSGRPWRLVSHAQLSRGVSIRPARGPRLVVVDEAHRFRSPGTLRYGALARLVRPGEGGDVPEVLLLTATPINNRPEDLYHLLRLFLDDDALRDVGVPSLQDAFLADPVSADGPLGRMPSAAPDSARARAVVREVVVRRSRRMVRDRFARAGPGAADVRFPSRAPPDVVRYDDPAIADRVAGIEALELTGYGRGAGPLIRSSLLKRADSSRAAFAVSVQRLCGALRAVAEAADDGRLLRPAEHRARGDSDPLQLTLLGVVAGEAPPDIDLAALARSCRRDLAVLGRLVRPEGPDPKLEALGRLLARLGDEKVVVFTEFRDSAEAIWRWLAPRHRVGRVDGAGAWLGGRPAGRRTVVDRFAPGANGRPAPPVRERVDVLVATDVLAEGLNLQDARHVVSYDLPWNPVRLLQRIGRVDRLGTHHAVVVPHLFVPATGLDVVLGLTRRLRSKLHGIASTVGEEQADELLAGLARGSAAETVRALDLVERDPDPWESLRTMWMTARHEAPPRSDTAWVAALASRPDAGLDVRAILLVSCSGSPRLFEVGWNGDVRAPGPAAATAVGRALGDCPVGGPAPGLEARGREIAASALERLRREQAAVDVHRPRLPAGPASRLVRELRSALAASGSALDPGLIREADTLLAALESPLPAGTEDAVERLLDGATPRDRNAHDLVRAAATLLHSRARDPKRVDAAFFRVRAILLVERPAGPPERGSVTLAAGRWPPSITPREPVDGDPRRNYLLPSSFPRSSAGRAGGC